MRMFVGFCAVALWSAIDLRAVHAGDDSPVPPAIKRIKADSDGQRDTLVDRAKEKVQAARKTLEELKVAPIDADLHEDAKILAGSKTGIVFKTRAIKDDRIAKFSQSLKEAEKRLADGAAGKRALIPVLSPPFEKGQIGTAKEGMLVHQVIDDENMIGQLRFIPDTFWISGLSTSGISDDSAVYPDDVFQVVDTKSYASTSGARRTVKQLRRLTRAEARKIMDQVDAQK